MKKAGLIAGLFVVCILSFIFISSFVSAYYFPDVRSTVQSVIDAYVDFAQPILEALFGGVGWSGLYLFERFLVFIVLISMVYIAVGKVPLFEDKKFVKWIIAIIVPLIGMRFIDFEWLNTIFLSYEVLAIVLASALPVILYFFFLTGIFPGGSNAFMRKLGWLLFAMVYAGLWFTSYNQIKSAVFFWTMLVAVALAFFDGYIERMLTKRDIMKADRGRVAQILAQLDHDIKTVHASDIPVNLKKERLKQLEDQRKYWIKRL